MFHRIKKWVKNLLLKLSSPSIREVEPIKENKPHGIRVRRALQRALFWGAEDCSKIYGKNYCVNCGRDHYRKNTLSCSAKCYRELRAKQKTRSAA